MSRWPVPKKRAAKHKRGTSLTLSEDELTALAQFVGVGKAVLQTKHRITGRLRGAMTRLGLTPPAGL
jgi:hypothetical protein